MPRYNNSGNKSEKNNKYKPDNSNRSEDRKKNYRSNERPFGNRKRTYNPDEKPFGERRKSYKPDDKPFGERKRSYNPDNRNSDDRRKRYNSDERPFGDRKKSYNPDERPFGERRKSYKPNDKPFGERKRSHNSNERQFEKRSFNRPKKDGYSANPRPNNNQQSKKSAQSYNPLMFIKTVEEQTIAPTYNPKHKFEEFLIESQIKKNIISRGYVAPTPIQDQVIPLILEGKDVIGTANTGTGKTAAFLIPLIHNVMTKKTAKVLIITPTRELAAQIQEELGHFKSKTGLNSSLCIGGVSLNLQIQHLKRNPEFVIGTPGRLKDLDKTRNINFSHFTSIVLDEVDTMLDMGFIKDIKEIISKLPHKRNSLFFSATIPNGIKEIMNKFLHNPVTVSVKTRQSAENVNQTTIKIDPAKKLDQLHDLLIKPDFKKVIIFSRTKRAVDKLSRSLKERGFEISAIHGDKSQAQRKKALANFKDDQIKILLATDVVARGIDIDDVSHVINFDMPQTYEDYIHRIGRTGRANKIGQAITFVD